MEWLLTGDDQKSEPITLREVFGSVLAAGFGVQSQRNREGDFARGSAKQLVIVGLIATVLFASAIILLVKLIVFLSNV